jgi:DNA-binding transcriptional LysR family regulator
MFPGTQSKDLDTRAIFTEPLCVALSREHPLARARQLKIGQLAHEPFVMASEAVSPSLRATIVDHCAQGGFAPDVRFEVQLQQTVLSLVDEGVGIALVPESMRKAQLAGVVFRPLADAPTISQMLVWSPLNRNPCLARFLEIAWKRRTERNEEENRAPAHSSADAGKQRYR